MKKKLNLLILVLYFLTLSCFTIYSYALVDPNITLFNHPIWAIFREIMVQLGYYQRFWSVVIYLFLVVSLIIFNLYFWKNYKKYSPIKIAVLISVCLFLTYPFLSHDFFNYLFDAKILTFYHKNPYFFSGLDFNGDPWLRFMHWTHRKYPYGPGFLLISAIPSLLGIGKFFITYLLFKLLFIGSYLLAVFSLVKINKRIALFFATQPLLIVEGLGSLHNDFIAVNLAIFGIYLITVSKKRFLAGILFFLSSSIKYISFPSFFLFFDKKIFNYLALFLQLLVLIYFSFFQEIQPWYFLNLLIFLSFFEMFVINLSIFFAGLLFSYYPYIFLGGWDSNEKILLKHQIILFFFVLNCLYFVYRFWNKKLSK